MNETVYTVGYINSYIKNMFTQDYMLRSINVKGELSGVTYNSKGHIYFTLKDDTGVLKCVMFAGKTSSLKFRLEQGQKVTANGYIGIYEANGSYQLYVNKVTKEGTGDLFERYEKLKAKLSEMGMFAEEYKQKIPDYAKKVGIVTSKTGAAIQDIIKTSKLRNPYVQLILYPATVQGEEAAQSIANGIRVLDEYGVDVIIVGRGGGSIEDLWCFNEELVANAIFNCRTPIVSAVGHESDTTIADYVADLRVATPTAAAQRVVFSIEDFYGKLLEYKSGLDHEMSAKLSREKLKLESAKLKIDKLNPEMILDGKRMSLIHYEQRLSELMEQIITSKKHTYQLLIEQMKTVSPLEKLSKGYAYAEYKDRPLKSVSDIKKEDKITLYLKDGKLVTEVIDIIGE